MRLRRAPSHTCKVHELSAHPKFANADLTTASCSLPQFHISADKSARRPKPVRLVRSFLLEEVYRRVKLLFDPFEEWVFSDEQDVLRMSVPAVL